MEVSGNLGEETDSVEPMVEKTLFSFLVLINYFFFMMRDCIFSQYVKVYMIYIYFSCFFNRYMEMCATGLQCWSKESWSLSLYLKLFGHQSLACKLYVEYIGL